MLIDTSVAKLLGSSLSDKGTIRACDAVIRAGDGIKKEGILIASHALTNNKCKFRSFYSWNNLPKIIKDGVYVVNLGKHKSTETHRVALYMNDNTTTYFDSYGLENIPEEVETITGNENNIVNVFGMQACDLIMCGYFCVGFIDFNV